MNSSIIQKIYRKYFATKVAQDEKLLQLNSEEAVDVESGEIVYVEQVSKRWQQFEGIEYAKANSDVPLYKQSTEPGEQLRMVITGKFDSPRREIVESLNKLGIKVGSAVNGKTDVLIIGEWGREVGSDGVSNKFLRAKELGTQIVRLESVTDLLDFANRKIPSEC